MFYSPITLFVDHLKSVPSLWVISVVKSSSKLSVTVEEARQKGRMKVKRKSFMSVLVKKKWKKKHTTPMER